MIHVMIADDQELIRESLGIVLDCLIVIDSLENLGGFSVAWYLSRSSFKLLLSRHLSNWY